MINCPVCGAQAPVNFRFTKLTVCTHCKTSLFLEDNAVKYVGKKSAIVETPSLFTLGHRYRYREHVLEAIGRIQFSYGKGYWDEWWMLSATGDGCWVSVDEGDIAFETKIESAKRVPDCTAVKVGDQIRLNGKLLHVTELNKSICIGIEGSLPEVIFPGEEHDYVECLGSKGLLYTIECFEGQKQLYKGSWIDPFEIKPF